MDITKITLTPKAFTFFDQYGTMVMYPTSKLNRVYFGTPITPRRNYVIEFDFSTGTESFFTKDKEQYLVLLRSVEKNLNAKF